MFGLHNVRFVMQACGLNGLSYVACTPLTKQNLLPITLLLTS